MLIEITQNQKSSCDEIFYTMIDKIGFLKDFVKEKQNLISVLNTTGYFLTKRKF